MKHHRVATIGLVAAALAVAVAHQAVTARQADPRHVVVISIDGLKPSVYNDSGPSKVPTLRRIAQEGVFATAVLGVTPTVTYPSHTTMVTGVPPTVHGIYNNRILDPEETSNASWYWYARDVKVPTLYGAVKARGLTTAAVSWPVTVDADIDYLMPEFGGVTRHPRWLDLMRALSKPRNLLDNYEAQGTPLAWPMTDDDRTGLAAWIFRTYRPNLLLLHIFATDDAQHAFGPGSPEALAAIEGADGKVQQMIQAVADTGLQDRTDLVVLSDHGFLPLEQQLQPNYIFKREGLLEVDDAGKVSRWNAYFYSAGGSGFILLKNPDDAALRARVAALLQKLAADPANGIRAVWSQEELRTMNAEPRAAFGIDMKDGFYSANGHDALLKKSASRGGHGFAPTRPDLYASLMMRGPDVPKGGSLGMVRMSQIGPTVASWFGVKLSPAADVPLALPAKRP
jgi:predicted AlkP superfamily pyrophosphatase or phosphodiesterase